jgi:hypothetical protein
MGANVYMPFKGSVALLRAEAERAAATSPELVRVVQDAIKRAIALDPEPYALICVLIEGIVTTLIRNFPEEQRTCATALMVRLLWGRLVRAGVVSESSLDWASLIRSTSQV